MDFPILSSIIFIPFIGSLFILSKSQNNQSAIYVPFSQVLQFYFGFIFVVFIWPYTYWLQFIEEKNWISGYIKFKLYWWGFNTLAQ